MKNDRLTSRLENIKRLVANSPDRTESTDVPPRYARLALAVGGETVVAPAGCYLKIETVFPFGFEFGSDKLGEPGTGISVAVSSYTALESDGEAPLSGLVFIDTETTGLGGAGAVPFLVGCGSLERDGFSIRQYLLPDYSDEAAMLEQVLAELGQHRTLVSYNGAAFDLNLLRDRFIVNRVAREVPCAGHFDLLHSVRRLFKRRLGDCSLTSIEREIFGFYRQNDIPGHLIPSIYFDWLQTESTVLLPGVLEHNRLDILSLYFLLLRIDRVFRSEGSVLDYTDDIYSLSRVYGRRKHHRKIIANFETLRKITGSPLPDEVLLFHSMAYKREGNWEGAVELWRRLADSGGSESVTAALELAKHYEHRVKDARQALNYALKAQQSAGPGRRLGDGLRIRVDRLRRKLAAQTR